MKSIPNDAMILAAGYGKRMLPLTKRIAKPLVKVDNEPIIHHIIKKLKFLEVKNIIVNTHHLPELFAESFKIFKNSVQIIYEKEILETGGGVLNAIYNEKLIKESTQLFIINGDTFWIEKEKSSFENLYENWNIDEMDVLLALKEKELMFGYEGFGDFDFIDCHRDLGKIHNKNVNRKYVFSGLQLLNSSLFRSFKKKSFSLREVYYNAMKNNRLYGIVDKNDWFHISTPENLEEINSILKKI